MEPKELIAYPKITQNYQKFFSTFKIMEKEPESLVIGGGYKEREY